MYRKYFGLQRYPFGKEIAGEELYRSRDFTAYQEKMDFLQKHGGIGVVWGSPGSGKSVGLRWLRDSLNRNRFRFYYLPDPPLSLSEFYRSLATAMALRPAGRRAAIFRQVQEHILELSGGKKIKPIIALDESQMLPHTVLEAVRLLLNFDIDSRDHAILLLCGQPELRKRLHFAVYEPLIQRVTVHYQFAGLQPEEVEQYLRHRLAVAGVQDQIFEPAAVQFIAQVSKGILRKIDTLAVRSLAGAAAAKQKSVAQGNVERAMEETLWA